MRKLPTLFYVMVTFIGTRPEVSKLTPENKRNSQSTRLSPAESSEARNRLTHIKENQKYLELMYKLPRNISRKN